MFLESIASRVFTPSPLPLLCAAAVVLLSWIAATFAPTQFRKLQSAILPILHKDAQNDSKLYQISQLTVYPVKSCRGISVRRTNMHMHGLYLDRQWMFVSGETHKFVTMRQLPKMTLINTQISEDGQNLILSVAEDRVSIPAQPSQEWLQDNTTVERVTVWDDETDAYMYGPSVNEPFSRFLGRDVRLVYKGPSKRILRKNGAPAVLGRTQSTFFADGFPLLIASEASIDELNSRLTAKDLDAITIERFRPNIVVRGNKPWAEDAWLIAKVYSSSTGDEDNSENNNNQPIILDVVSRCTRCTIPNVEPETAVAHKKEPSSTLSSYRRIDPGAPYGAIFGMNAVPQNEGLIEVGMKFEVLEETDHHRILKD